MLTLTPHPDAEAGTNRPADQTRPWRRSESNRLRRRLQGVPAPLAVIPMTGAPVRLGKVAGPGHRSKAVTRSISGPSQAHRRRRKTVRLGWPHETLSTIELIMCMHVRQNNGGASHGCQESNLVSAGFGDQPPIRWLTHLRYCVDPKEKPPARACVLGAASVSAALRGYPDAHLLGRYDPMKDMAISQSRPGRSAHR